MLIDNGTITNTKLNTELEKFLYQTAKKYTDTNFFKKHIQIQNDPNKTASSEASFIMSAPPSLEGTLAYNNFQDLLQLIGGVPQLNQSEQLQTSPFGEIGSRLLRFLPGGTNYQLQLGRLYTRHSNIKYPMYKWLFKVAHEKKESISLGRLPSNQDQQYIRDWSGLESELYNIPFGLIIVRCTAVGDLISADFCEMCMITNVGSSYSSDGVSIVENLSLYVCSIVPFATAKGNLQTEDGNTLGIIKGSNAAVTAAVGITPGDILNETNINS